MRNLGLILVVGAVLGVSVAAAPAKPQVDASTTVRAPDPVRRSLSQRTSVRPNLPSIFVASDSTAARGSGADQQGWAVPFAGYFDPEKINIINRARGGRSSRTFIAEGLWDGLLQEVQEGDWVLIQFGHNDGGRVYDDGRARKSIPGNGDETLEVTLPGGLKETVRTYGWYLRKYIEDTKAVGATPIVCSPVPRNLWSDGKVRRASDSYGHWAREAAAAGGALFVDLKGLVADRYEALGQEAVKPFFPNEHTHTGWDGAVLSARCVVDGIKGLRGASLRDFLLADPPPPPEP